MAWRTAGGILALHRQLKTEVPAAAPPATPASSWGTIGDAAHNPTSDHAPKDFPGWGNDIVTAGDIPHAPWLGLNARFVLNNIRQSRDARVKYGISQGQMFSSYWAGGVPPWTWRAYTGSDGHFTHAHLSLVGDARADGQHPWATGYTVTPPAAEEKPAMIYTFVQKQTPGSNPAVGEGQIWIRYGPAGGRYPVAGNDIGLAAFAESALGNSPRLDANGSPLWIAAQPEIFGPIMGTNTVSLSDADRAAIAAQLAELDDTFTAEEVEQLEAAAFAGAQSAEDV
jgi:hypothetical protein